MCPILRRHKFDYRVWASRFGSGSTAARRGHAGITALWPTCSTTPCPVACRTGSRGLWRLSRFEGFDPTAAIVGSPSCTNRVCFVLARGRVCSPSPDTYTAVRFAPRFGLQGGAAVAHAKTERKDSAYNRLRGQTI
jgi:hypothetical protein